MSMPEDINPAAMRPPLRQPAQHAISIRPANTMLDLSAHERQWLNAYRDALAARYSGVVERVAVFGSKARGDAGADSDLDVLVLVNTDDRRAQRDISRIGHDLATELSFAADAQFIAASIMVYSAAEWAQRVFENAAFQTAVEREAFNLGGKVAVMPTKTPTENELDSHA